MIAKGISKQVAIKKETTYGTLAGASGGRLLRRVTSAFNLAKDTYQSNEIRTDYQMADFRHGVRSMEGSLSAEFSPGSYSDLMAAALAKDFAAGVSITGAAINTAAGAGSTYTLTRGSGSFITDGFRVGDVIRITAATGLNADTLNKNLLILTLTATVATVIVLNGSTITVPGTGTAVSVSVTGKKTFVPQTGHTNDSFTIEEWFADITQSEVYTGCKVNTVGFSVPATGIATLDIGFMGKDLTSTGTSQYFTSPTAQSTSGVFAGVNGAVIFNGAQVAVITDFSLNVNRNIANATVLGSNSIAEAFNGRAIVDGSMGVYFDGVSARDAFKNETEVSIVLALTTSNSATADFISICLPRVKINSFTKDDNETGITASCDFQALLNPVNTAGGEITTITIQDSLAA